MRNHDGMTTLRLSSSSGRIRVIAEERADVEIERGVRHGSGDTIEVRGGSGGVVVRVPTGTELVIGSSSGAVELEGACGPVSVTTRSGRVVVDGATELDARTISGRIEVRRVIGQCRCKTGNGAVQVGRAEGEVHVATVSGRVEIDDATGPLRVSTVSGRVEASVREHCDVRVDSVSGSVCIAVPADARPSVSMRSVSGSRTVEPEAGTDLEVVARSISGALAVVCSP